MKCITLDSITRFNHSPLNWGGWLWLVITPVLIKEGFAMAEVTTKGAQRRRAYVSLVLDSAFIGMALFLHWNGWLTTALVILACFSVSNNLHILSDIGFTSRADNEQ